MRPGEPARVAGDEATFALTKGWVDPAPGIELVEVHYAWTAPAQPPDWERHGQAQVLSPVPGSAPPQRAATIEVPRRVDGSPGYLLHHFFFVVSRDQRAVTPVVTEEIAAHEVTYDDPDGAYTHVGMQWQVAGQPAPNYTAMALDGLEFGDADAPGVAFAPIYEFVQAVPLPHVFRGLVWGPKGQAVEQVFHLLRVGSPDPADDLEAWDDNQGRGWRHQI